MRYLIFTILFLNYFYLQTAVADVTIANQVILFIPGKGQNAGQEAEYFPENIFTLPPQSAGKNFQASDPKDVCSIGLGGKIVLFFKDGYVVDGPGVDITVFENAFVNPVTNKIFAEPAKVAVSEDGIDFIEFPYDSLTLDGCAGVHWVNGKGNPFNPEESGGDQFDLASIGVQRIRYIKITDICQSVLDNKQHPYYDPIISGFDLDCVVGLHLLPVSDINENPDTEYRLSSISNQFSIHFFNDNSNKSIEIYNIIGNRIYEGKFNSFFHFNLENYQQGLYFINIIYKNNMLRKKILITR